MTTVLTLRLDHASQMFFEGLRQRHFPPERNQIAAHLTLFHKFPDGADISAELASAVGQVGPFSMSVTGLRSLGRGVAYTLASGTLQSLHTRLAASFAEHLSPQDRQRFQPHVVIQNKVTPEAARNLLASLQPSFVPFEVEAIGLDLWAYLGGPWRHMQTYAFSA